MASDVITSKDERIWRKRVAVLNDFDRLRSGGGTAKQWSAIARRAQRLGERATTMRAKALASMASTSGQKIGAVNKFYTTSYNRTIRSVMKATRGGASSVSAASSGAS